jgi:hypothetical protein
MRERGEPFTAADAADEIVKALGPLTPEDEELVRQWWAGVFASPNGQKLYVPRKRN